ncbi:pentapeptide repeat-containing protein, partial [Streptomyces virginiae]
MGPHGPARAQARAVHAVPGAPVRPAAGRWSGRGARGGEDGQGCGGTRRRPPCPGPADPGRADLRRADLRRADLGRADLRRADRARAAPRRAPRAGPGAGPGRGLRRPLRPRRPRPHPAGLPAHRPSGARPGGRGEGLRPGLGPVARGGHRPGPGGLGARDRLRVRALPLAPLPTRPPASRQAARRARRPDPARRPALAVAREPPYRPALRRRRPRPPRHRRRDRGDHTHRGPPARARARRPRRPDPRTGRRTARKAVRAAARPVHRAATARRPRTAPGGRRPRRRRAAHPAVDPRDPQPDGDDRRLDVLHAHDRAHPVRAPVGPRRERLRGPPARRSPTAHRTRQATPRQAARRPAGRTGADRPTDRMRNGRGPHPPRGAG